MPVVLDLRSGCSGGIGRFATAEQFHDLLAHMWEPYRTMALIAGCLGLRAGEIVGLQSRVGDCLMLTTKTYFPLKRFDSTSH